ncbi:MAG: hypothetical protein CL868_02715 [Cytophagaceae bacterium]|nr:hypothetical protein [Cytophagaceae bacterium]|tara:strand:+ start:3789 stop:4289 length:501 start_codon:yes stop_codon:yes gene_type:complete
MEEIVNRVASSKLKTFDLEDYYPQGKRMQLDISQWLVEGFLLRESSFRESLKTYNWEQYDDAYVALHCSTDAIIPGWAFMLVTTYLAQARKVVKGTLEDLETILFTEQLNTVDYSKFEGEYVIVKGCSNKPVPQNAYLLLLQRLQPIVKSLMYGEACSSVPLYKKK